MQSLRKRERLRNLAWAVGMGVLFGLSPHTGVGRNVFAIAGGSGMALLVFGLSEYAQRRRAKSHPERERVPSERAFAAPTALAVVCVLAYGAVFAPTLAWMYEEWTSSIWTNGHGLFLPVGLVWLSYAILRRVPNERSEPSAWGFAFVLAGLALALLDAGIHSEYVGALGFALGLPGLSLLLLGKSTTRRLWLPLTLCLFLVPVPQILGTYTKLTYATAIGIKPALYAFGIPVLRDESVLFINQGYYGITDRCSGYPALYAAYALALVFAVYTRSGWRRVLLFLAPWPLVVAANVFRTTVLLVMIATRGHHILDTSFHGLTGIVAYWIVLAGMLALADWKELRRRLL